MFNRQHMFPLTRSLLGGVWHETRMLADLVGQSVLTLGTALRFIVRGRVRLSQVMEQSAFIGVDALGIATILTLFSGMVIALQVAQELTKQGAGQLVGALVSITILRELAPVMTGFAVIAMVGSAYSAELATMQTQKQVDALKVLHVDPIRYLVVPRLLAGMAMLPCMTILTAMAGIVGGMVISNWIAGLNFNLYLESVWHWTEPKDLFGAELKALVFGGLIVAISTTIGIATKGGSREVGVATTRAVVWSFVAMAIADYLLSFLLFGGES